MIQRFIYEMEEDFPGEFYINHPSNALHHCFVMTAKDTFEIGGKFITWLRSRERIRNIPYGHGPESNERIFRLVDFKLKM